MRTFPRLRALSLAATLLAAAACESTPYGPSDPAAPYDVGYQLQPSGDPNQPLGILLFWNPPSNGRAVSYDVYARSYTGEQFARRATTTSPTFHDAGNPQLQYYVQAIDGNGYAMGSSPVITVSSASRLPTPLGLTSTSLNGAVHLTWSGNAVTNAFDHYRVYSATYPMGAAQCANDWTLEGTTVADGFLVANIPNGVRRCFAVSAVDYAGLESFWSAARADTPRLDSRFVLVWSQAAKPDSAGFVFQDAGPVFGRVAGATHLGNDFRVENNAGTLYITPMNGAQMQAFGTGPVADLTHIGAAPATGYATTSLSAVPGWGYVFRTTEPDGTHYGAVRVQHVTADYVVIDWSFQTGVGNPELARQGEDARLRM